MQHIITTATVTSPALRAIRPERAVQLHVIAMWQQYLTWRARRATKLLLKSLDDRTLADIGVSRTGIDAVVRDIETQRTRWYVG
jgi:uncharacterized protein YjiS (DUF1127 family)